MELKNQKGITLITLTITIIVLFLLAGITIQIGTSQIEQAKDNKAIVEIEIIQHAILEKYTKSSLTQEENLIGEALTSQELETMKQTLKSKGEAIKGEESHYQKINTSNASSLGISQITDEYIINYQTGEVFNLTKKTTKSGELLYTYAKENE